MHPDSPWRPVWVRDHVPGPAHLSSNGGRSTVCGHEFDQPGRVHPATGDADPRCQDCHDVLTRARAAVARRGLERPP